MKHLIFICVSSLVFTSCIKKGFDVSYSTANSDVLYVGVEHFIKFGNKENQIDTAFCNKGSLTHIDSNLYMIYPDTSSGNIKVTLVKNDKEKELDFRVKHIPGIFVYAGTDTAKYIKNINAKNFRKFKFLKTGVENFDHSLLTKVKSFELTRISNDKAQTVRVKKPSIGPNRSNYLAKKAKSGDVYIFKSIIISISPDYNKIDKTYYRKMANLVYYIN